jgi:type IV secretion system protein TrbL
MRPDFAPLAVTEPDCTAGMVTCGIEGIGAGVSDVVGGIGGFIGGAADAIGAGGAAVGDAVGGATGFVDFWGDPAGNSFDMLQAGAKGLSDTVLPAITSATMPDLTAEWFINSYRISFGIAIFVFVIVLIPQFVRTARGQQSGRDLGESLGLYAPMFLLGAAFGPAIGAVLVKFFGALSDSIISWGVNTSSATIVEKFSAMLDDSDKGAGLAGGAIIGIILMLLMILGLLIVVLILIVQLITLYFSGILFPLGLVWIVDPTKRTFGLKIGYLWLGILASHPLLFFMLAIAYQMVAGSIDVFGEVPTLERTITLVVSILALLIAGLSPVLLTKFAPVIPTGGAGAAPSGGGTIGSNSMQQADAKQSDSGSQSSSGNDSSSSSSPSSSTATSTNSTSSNSDSSDSTSTSSTSTSTSGGGEEASSSISTATKGNAAAGGEAAEAGASSAGAGAATAGAGAAGGAAAAEGGLAAAGAAESATGVGAVVGVPTMIAAGAIAAAEATKKMTDSVGEAAASPVDDLEQHYGKDSTS